MMLGGIWIAGAAFNVFVTLPHASSSWNNLGENATFGPYRWFFDTVAGGAPAFWALIVIAGELLLGSLLRGRDPWARYGVILSVAWCLFIIWPYTLTTIPLLVLAGWLLRHDHDQNVVDLLRQRGMPDRLHRAGV
jgi:hypothetical protein